MSYVCTCPLWGHVPGCPLGNTGGTVTIRTNGTGPLIEPAPCRVPWECPRCKAINAPHADRCSCAPAVVSIPSVLGVEGDGYTAPDSGFTYRTTQSNLESLRDAGLITFTN